MRALLFLALVWVVPAAGQPTFICNSPTCCNIPDLPYVTDADVAAACPGMATLNDQGELTSMEASLHAFRLTTLQHVYLPNLQRVGGNFRAELNDQLTSLEPGQLNYAGTGISIQFNGALGEVDLRLLEYAGKWATHMCDVSL
jgi:hypothetical protein